MSVPELSARLLGRLDLADDAVFGWLSAFAVDAAKWSVLLRRAEVARTSSALSFRYGAPMLWRDVPDGTYGVIARYDHGRAHYAIPRTARLPNCEGAPSHARGRGVAGPG